MEPLLFPVCIAPGRDSTRRGRSLSRAASRVSRRSIVTDLLTSCYATAGPQRRGGRDPKVPAAERSVDSGLVDPVVATPRSGLPRHRAEDQLVGLRMPEVEHSGEVERETLGPIQ